jgi:exonuclease III
MISPILKKALVEATIEKNWDMSDHAPVSVTYDFSKL